MSITAPVYDKADPKSEKLYPFHVPTSPEWAEKKDFFGQSSMMGAGAGMFLKNPLIIWACLIASVISFVNHEPLRAAKDANSPLMGVGLGFMGLLTMSLPKMLLPPETQAPVPPAA